jgi:tetratricopeptide (TPR) repeat protein
MKSVHLDTLKSSKYSDLRKIMAFRWIGILIAHSRIDGVVRLRNKKRKDMDLNSGMSQDKDNNTERPAPAATPQAQSATPAGPISVQSVNAQDVFSSEVMLESSKEELFVGELSFLRDLTSPSVPHSSHRSDPVGPSGRWVYMILGSNLLLMLVVAGVIWFGPAKVVNFKVTEPSLPATVQPSGQVETRPPVSGQVEAHVPVSGQVSQENQQVSVADAGSEKLVEAFEKVALTPQDQELLKRGVSLKTADDFFAAGRYLEAGYVYNQISQNWSSSATNGQYLRDFLKLRIGVCMHRAGESHAQEECFTQALQSRSAYVRGMACYYMACIRFKNQAYLEARQKAYQAIALCKSFEDMLLTNLEADMYFLIADSLTREVLGLYNMGYQLPGRDWSDSLMDIWPAESDALRLEEALCRTAEKIGQGAGNPRLTVDLNRPVGSQWSLVCLQSPLEETLWKIVSEGNLKAVWADDSQALKDYPVTAYMMFMPQQYVAETVCGSTGLIWCFDGQNVSILNPKRYTDFESHRKDLIGEAISVWQRFLMRYRSDNRIPNVHYALGRLYTFSSQSAAALGEFKLLQGRFSDNALAPYAYLEAGKIKVDTKDYDGASHELNEMLLEYPDCPIADEVTLYLAQMTLEGGQTQQAKELFGRSFQMNLSQGGKCEAAVGLGRCAYIQQDWNEVQTWLSRAIELIQDKENYSTGDIYFMLGKSYLELGQYANGNAMLRAALNGKLSEKEYMQTVLELVEVECRQKNYVEALNILEHVPPARLSQEDSCDLLIAKARVFCEIGVAESAVSLLRKKIEFVADSRLRARLTLELAVCYMMTQKYSLARRELNNVMSDMPDAYHAARATLVLAQIIEKLGQPEHAENLCVGLLDDPQTETKLRNEAFDLLGRIYTSQKYYEKAALAFAGILPQGVIRP